MLVLAIYRRNNSMSETPYSVKDAVMLSVNTQKELFVAFEQFTKERKESINKTLLLYRKPYLSMEDKFMKTVYLSQLDETLILETYLPENHTPLPIE